MRNPGIFYPVLAMACWTFLVLMLIPVVRVRASLRREIGPDDFKLGESASVPPYVSLPNRNFMNLLELPTLFYVVCMLLYITAGVSSLAIALAWAYVATRVLHSAIHISYNKVLHRLAVFSLSNVVLGVLWVLAAVHLLTNAQS
jgi:hypothetical protein